MKRILAMAVTVIMMLGILSGCYNDYRLKEFNIDVGDEIAFGTYQDEEIEWEVLARHFIPEEGTVRIRLLSKYALDCKPFNEDGESSWEDSSLREWLNNDFYNNEHYHLFLLFAHHIGKIYYQNFSIHLIDLYSIF